MPFSAICSKSHLEKIDFVFRAVPGAFDIKVCKKSVNMTFGKKLQQQRNTCMKNAEFHVVSKFVKK